MKQDSIFSKFYGWLKAQHTEKYFGAGLVVVAAIVVLSFLSMNTCYEVRIDGEAVGYVSSTATFDTAMHTAQETKAASVDLPLTGVYNTVTAEKTHVLFAPKMTTEQLAQTLENQLEWLTSGTCLNINNGESQFVLANEAECQKVLDTLMAENTVSDPNVIVKSMDFTEDVRTENSNVRISQLQNAEDVLNAIKTGKEALEIHEVVEGESLWSIATSNGLTVDELKALNPQLETERLQIGQELTLNSLKPLLSVRLTKEVTVEETIAYATQTEETASLLRGEKEVKVAGQEGKKLVTYNITESNGVTLEKDVLNEIILQEPVTQVVSQGTSTLAVASRGSTGPLSWPKTGKINSPYGSRSRGFHTGIDISAKTGDPIKAAAGGKVVTAGWTGSYGYCVVIDHNNGLKTRYAHLSKVQCSVGDTVERGEVVGLAGSTGNSTGPHLHFEVIVNGETKNPMNYLN